MAGVLLRPVWPVARREEGASPTSGAVTDEQRSHRPNWAQPKGRQSFSLQASLLTPYRSTSGYARRSRLAWTEKPLPQNTSHLGDTTLESGGAQCGVELAKVFRQFGGPGDART